jgi:hypothetical protein
VPVDVPDWAMQVGDFRQLLATDTNTPAAAPAPTLTTLAGGTAAGRVTLKLGVVAVRVMATANGLPFSYLLNVTGHQSQVQYFGDPANPGAKLVVVNPSAPLTVPIERDVDTQLDLAITGDPFNPVNYFVSELTLAEMPGQSAVAQSVTQPSPSPWQSPQFTIFGFQGGVGTTVIRAGVGGRVLLLWDGTVDVLTAAAGAQGSIQDTAGGVVIQFGAHAEKTFGAGFRARPLPMGLGLQIQVGGGAATVQLSCGGSVQ